MRVSRHNFVIQSTNCFAVRFAITIDRNILVTSSHPIWVMLRPLSYTQLIWNLVYYQVGGLWPPKVGAWSCYSFPFYDSNLIRKSKNRKSCTNQHKRMVFKNKPTQAEVVAHLDQWSLPTPEVCNSNTVIGKFLKKIYLLSTVHWKISQHNL